MIEGGVYVKGQAKLELKDEPDWNDCEDADCYFGSFTLSGDTSTEVAAVFYGCLAAGID